MLLASFGFLGKQLLAMSCWKCLMLLGNKMAAGICMHLQLAYGMDCCKTGGGSLLR